MSISDYLFPSASAELQRIAWRRCYLYGECCCCCCDFFRWLFFYRQRAPNSSKRYINSLELENFKFIDSPLTSKFWFWLCICTSWEGRGGGVSEWLSTSMCVYAREGSSGVTRANSTKTTCERTLKSVTHWLEHSTTRDSRKEKV